MRIERTAALRREESLTCDLLFTLRQDHLDLDGSAERQLSHTNCGASVPAGVAEHLTHQPGGAIDHEMLIGKRGIRINISGDANYSGNVI